MDVEEIRKNLKYYTGMPVLDQAHDDIEYLLKEVKRLNEVQKKLTEALEEIAYNGDETRDSKVKTWDDAIILAREVLQEKEPTPE